MQGERLLYLMPMGRLLAVQRNVWSSTEDWPRGYMHYKPALRLVRRNGVTKTRKTGNTQGLSLEPSFPRQPHGNTFSSFQPPTPLYFQFFPTLFTMYHIIILFIAFVSHCLTPPEYKLLRAGSLLSLLLYPKRSQQCLVPVSFCWRNMFSR